MNSPFSSTSVGYICIATVVIAFILSSSANRVSDEAVKAQAEACAKIGQKPYISLTSNQLLLDCRATEPASADVQAR